MYGEWVCLYSADWDLMSVVSSPSGVWGKGSLLCFFVAQQNTFWDTKMCERVLYANYFEGPIAG